MRQIKTFYEEQQCNEWLEENRDFSILDVRTLNTNKGLTFVVIYEEDVIEEPD